MEDETKNEHRQALIEKLAVPEHSFPALFRACRSEARLKEALLQMAEGLDAGEIANARLAEIKHCIGSAIYSAWSAFYDPFMEFQRSESKTAAEEEAEQFIWTINTPSGMHDLKALQKKLERQDAKLQKAGRADEHPFYPALRAFVAEMAPLAEAGDLLKGMAVKRKIKTDEEKAAEARYVPPMVDRHAEAALRGAFEKLTDDNYVALAHQIETRLRASLDRFMEAFGEGGGEDERRRIYSRDIEARTIGMRCAEGTGRSTYRLRADADQTIVQMATEQADMMREQFVVKNMRKLASIVDGKGDFERIEATSNNLSLSNLTGRFRLDFADGASFSIENSVVLNYSALGKPFLQFPLRFHDVCLGSGERLSMASEEWMNEKFAGRSAS